MKKYFIGLFLLMLAGCTPKIAWKPPANLTAKCEPLDKIEAGDGVSLAPWAVRTVSLYELCRARHEGLVKSIPNAS